MVQKTPTFTFKANHEELGEIKVVCREVPSDEWDILAKKFDDLRKPIQDKLNDLLKDHMDERNKILEPLPDVIKDNYKNWPDEAKRLEDKFKLLSQPILKELDDIELQVHKEIESLIVSIDNIKELGKVSHFKRRLAVEKARNLLRGNILS